MPKDKKPKVKKEWKELPACQVSDALLWEATKGYTSYLCKSNGTTISTDPLNLTGLNTKANSGIVSRNALGVEYTIEKRKIKVKKAKKEAPVVRVNLNIKTKRLIPKKNLVELKEKPKYNHCVYSTRRNITIRAAVKALRRDLIGYRRDLVPTALRRLYELYKFKKNNKYPKPTKKYGKK